MTLKSLLQQAGRKLSLSTTIGKPNIKDAPKWAKFVGITSEGSYHWLSNDTVAEDDIHDNFFPEAKRSEYTGFSEDKKSKPTVIEIKNFK